MLSFLNRLRKAIKRHHIVNVILMSIGLGALFVFILLFSIIRSLPAPELLDSRQVSESTKIYDKTGKVLLYEIFDEEKRTIIPFHEIPQDVKNATVAIEDKDFYTHPAFDLRSFMRAVIANLTDGFGSQGGSTITQQLAKNAFLSNEKTIPRKIKELILAFRLEKKFSKDEILNLYLNQIPYGSNAYGIESAAKTYFQKPAKELTLAEAALLAALPQAPSYYSPWGKNVTALLDRKNLVLQRMESLGYITAAERAEAQQQELTFERAANSIRAPHFVLTVQQYLNDTYGQELVRHGGLKVITTLDWELQQLAEKVVAAGAARNEELYKGTNAALMAQDATTGQVLAMAGSRDYFDSNYDGQFNVATQGLRQPGSAMKPFAYLAAFQKGFPADTVLFDLKTEFDTTGIESKSYQPENFDHNFRGPISMRNALAQSINVPAVKTAYLAGLDTILRLMKDFGVNTLTERSRYGLSLVLGGGEVRLNELLNAYATLAQEGVRHNQSMILSVADKSGKKLEEYKDSALPVAEAQHVRMVTDILSDPDARAPLFSGSLGLTVFPGYDVALKTGTTNDYRDAWTFGYTPTLAVGVWAGNNDNQPMQRSGGSILAAIPIWNAFMTEALKTQPSVAFKSPDPVTSEKVMLNGRYLPDGVVGNTAISQIHDILYYVDPNRPLGPAPVRPESDPQFKNWEEPVLAWAAVYGASSTLLGLPVGSIPPAQNTPRPGSEWSIVVVSPPAGARASSAIPVTALINLSGNDIAKVQVYFNNELIEQRIGNFGVSLIYQTTITPQTVLSQNVLKIVVTDDVGGVITREVLLVG